MTFAPTCFGSHRNHLQGAVQYLAKNYKYGSTVLVGMDVVNVMAACAPVCDVYRSQCRHPTVQYLETLVLAVIKQRHALSSNFKTASFCTSLSHTVLNLEGS
jgi:hypothetical protein